MATKLPSPRLKKWSGLREDLEGGGGRVGQDTCNRAEPSQAQVG